MNQTLPLQFAKQRRCAQARDLATVTLTVKYRETIIWGADGCKDSCKEGSDGQCNLGRQLRIALPWHGVHAQPHLFSPGTEWTWESWKVRGKIRPRRASLELLVPDLLAGTIEIQTPLNIMNPRLYLPCLFSSY